jgi:signal peptidase II
MLICAVIIILCVAVDQVTKWLALTYLAPLDSVPLIKNVLHLTYIENTGAAFGMLKNHRWVFMIVSTAAIIVIIAYLIKKKPENAAVRLALSLIVAGGTGNMIDRVMRGFVVDFIDVRIIKFYVFNGADSFVTVGCALLIIWIIAADIREERAKRAAAKASAGSAAADTGASVPEDARGADNGGSQNGKGNDNG